MSDYDQDDVTLGEVYRLCQRIEAKVNQTNGTVQDHAQKIAVLEDRSPGRVSAIVGGVVSAVISGFAAAWNR